jgi:hypothetical protein
MNNVITKKQLEALKEIIQKHKLGIKEEFISNIFYDFCKKANIKIMKEFIERADFYIRRKDNTRNLLLYNFCRAGNSVLAKWFLEKYTIDISNNKIFINICKTADIELVEWLIQQKPFNKINQDVFNKGLISACWSENANLKFVKYLEEKFNVTISTEYILELFYYCGEENITTIIKYFVEKYKIDINQYYILNQTILSFSCEMFASLNFIKYLVEDKKADIHKNNDDGSTVLHIACKRGNLEIIKYLIEDCMLDINAVDSKGNTPLSVVKNIEIINQLKEKERE